jgi:hypothetical protein
MLYVYYKDRNISDVRALACDTEKSYSWMRVFHRNRLSPPSLSSLKNRQLCSHHSPASKLLHLVGKFSLHIQADGDSSFHRKVGIHLPSHMASHLEKLRPQCSANTMKIRDNMDNVHISKNNSPK